MEEIFKNNREWVAEQLAKDPNYFKNLAKGQSPRYLFIGCSDSRVPANVITGTEAGDMFVHRNIANMVVHTDMNLLSVLQYAVDVLKVRDVIVCGHKECGGVAAAMTSQQFGLIDNWLRNIKDVIRLNADELDAIKDEKERRDRLVELNVIEQVKNLGMTSIVQNAWHRGQELNLHGLVYHVGEGILKDLKVDVSEFKTLDAPK
ncbi:carbonic anhydrase [Flammeovirgaceae bacterium 311]|nr:carbonic anhydrase [Flammeovirgaceae bacterium 311]